MKRNGVRGIAREMAVSERGPLVADDTLKVGLLMESAQAHQKLAEMHLERLLAHTQDLDAVVRQEIRRTLIDELQALTVESDRAARALRGMKNAANMRCLVWNLAIAVLCTAIPATIAHYALPSSSDLTTLRARRDSLAQAVARLEQRGGKVDWRSCGDSARLCVRIDRQAPVYGEKADYYVVKGY
ncbi:MAG: hypothetical protein JWN43_3272 [Gammaproteobacteria bacterium]|nr:hypothetical protein [Gammaproteobacteria bacterium]